MAYPRSSPSRQASALEGSLTLTAPMKVLATHRLSQPALDALDQMRRSCSVPLNLEGVLWDLELSNRLTVSQILLRRELRRMTPEERQSLSPGPAVLPR